MGEFSLSKHRYELALLALFLIGFYARIGLDGIFPANPGNVKASDPVYHTLVSEYIGTTGIVGRQPDFVSQGYKDALDEVPPLQSVIAGSLKAATGLEAWNSYYYIVCIFSALAIVLVYLISEKLFNSKDVAIIAAAAAAIPFAANRWFYTIFIGMWPQTSVYTLMLFSIYVSLLFIEKKKNIYLLIAGLTNAAVYLLHYSEIIFLIPINLYISWLIVSGKESILKKIRNLGILGVPVVLLALITFSTLIIIRQDSLPTGLSLHMVDFRNSFNYIPTLADLGWVYGIFICLAIVQLAMNRRKYLGFLLYSAFYLGLSFALPYLVSGEFYLLRYRFFAIYLFTFFVAYGSYYFLIKIPFKGKPRLAFPLVLAISALLLAIALPGYLQLQGALKGQIMPDYRYVGFRWMHDNSPRDSTVFYFGSDGQQEDNFMERVRYNVDLNRIGETLRGVNLSNEMPMMYPGRWSGFIGWTNLAYVTGPFSISHHPEREMPKSMLEFDYIYFENLNQDLAGFNSYLASYLVKGYGFRPVLNNQFTIILKNEKK